MKTKYFFIGVLSIFLVVSCSKNSLHGVYKIRDNFIQDEIFIEEISFSNENTVIISNGDLRKNLKYELKDGNIILITDFGNFSYSFSHTNGSVIIDGIEYLKITD